MTYKRLTDDERFDIYDKKKEGLSLRSIANLLGRSPSSISRELRRNSGRRGYRPKQAQQLCERRSHQRRGGIRPSNQVIWRAFFLVRFGFSPEQASGRCKFEGQGSISHETIYKYIYRDKSEGGILWKSLRVCKKYRKRYGAGRDRRGKISNRTGIESRPQSVALRTTIGHWEGDTVLGKGRKYVLVTLVERKTGYCCIAKTKTRHADEVTSAIIKALTPLKRFVKTITFDNGHEFSQHERISKSLGASIYFADPYASWQRGTNENLNGLVRQYFAKKSSLEGASEEKVALTQKLLNLRARKRLAWRCPEEVFPRTTNTAGVAMAL